MNEDKMNEGMLGHISNKMVDAFDQIFNDVYNTGVDACIEVVKKVKLPEGWTYLPDLKALINIQLEQLKKPLQ